MWQIFNDVLLQAVTKLKRLPINSTLLASPTSVDELHLMVDASKVGVDGALYSNADKKKFP